VLRDKTKLNASVTLESCSTGRERPFGMRNLFQEASARMSGRRVLAANRALDASMFEPEWEGSPPEKEDDLQCLTADRAVFREAGEDAYVLSPRGQPRCKELDEKDIVDNIGKVCLARCYQSCRRAQRDLRKKFPSSSSVQAVSLVKDSKLREDRKNNCFGFWPAPRAVCHLRVDTAVTRR